MTEETMRAVVQRVKCASVTADGEPSGEIGVGLLVLVAASFDDGETDIEYTVNKIAGLRIFEDEEGKMNLSVRDVSGSILIVSQFTLYGDARKGNRPSFAQAAPIPAAEALYDKFVEKTRALGLPVQTGVFRANMQVSLVNDGPVTILLDSKKNF